MVVFVPIHEFTIIQYSDGLVQDCSNSIANALELLQYCTKPSYKSNIKSAYLVQVGGHPL